MYTVLRYVERNAKKAKLVQRAEKWKWSSVWRRESGTREKQKMLSLWPLNIPKNYLEVLNAPLTKNEEEVLERSEERSVPYGSDAWIDSIITKYGIEQQLRPMERPKINDG